MPAKAKLKADKKPAKKATAKKAEAEQPTKQEQPARFADCVDSYDRLMDDVDEAMRSRGDKSVAHTLAKFIDRYQAVVKKIDWPLSILEKSDPGHANCAALKRMKKDLQTMFSNINKPE